MNNEEFQRIVIEELKGIKQNVGGLKEGQNNLEVGQQQLVERVGELEKRQENLEIGLRDLGKGQREIKKELGFVWDDIKKIDNRLEEQEIKISKVVS